MVVAFDGLSSEGASKWHDFGWRTPLQAALTISFRVVRDGHGVSLEIPHPCRHCRHEFRVKRMPRLCKQLFPRIPLNSLSCWVVESCF